METALALVASTAIGYALGSVPWAYLVSRRSGIAIERVDTGIAGAANVYRNVGHAWGIAVFLADAGKGAAAVGVAYLLGVTGALALPALAGSLVGHAYPAFGRFPGGAGLATLAGGAIVMGGWVGLAAAAVGVTMLVVLRSTGNAGALGFTAYVILGVVFDVDLVVIGGVLALGVVVLVGAKVRHQRRAVLR